MNVKQATKKTDDDESDDLFLDAISDSEDEDEECEDDIAF